LLNKLWLISFDIVLKPLFRGGNLDELAIGVLSGELVILFCIISGESGTISSAPSVKIN
jgi:hypothetical protein